MAKIIKCNKLFDTFQDFYVNIYVITGIKYHVRINLTAIYTNFIEFALNPK